MASERRLYHLRPLKVIVHPYSGEPITCSDDDGSQHDRWHVQAEEFCEDCADSVWVCTECQRCVSCCFCGLYHSTDCPWPV